MAKKKNVDDPVIEALLETMSQLYAAIILHAMEEGGPDLAKTVMEKLVWEAQRQQAEVNSVCQEIITLMVNQG